MKVTDFTRYSLAVRREREKLTADGWEIVGDNGGGLWELNRGGRFDQRILDVKISHDGKFLWVKVGKP